MRRSAFVALLFTLLLHDGFTASSTIPLPAAPVQPPSELGGSGSVFAPNKAPGAVNDSESVVVDSGFDGEARRVAVDQALAVHGTGDYSLVVQANALSVRTTGKVQPTLRRGAIVWAGFSSGEQTLVAHISLDPMLELTRLPFSAKVNANSAGGPYDGPTTVSVLVQNSSADLFSLADGDPEPQSLRDAVMATRSAISNGRDPVAGSNGIPESVSGLARASHQTPVPTVLGISVRVQWDSGSFEPSSTDVQRISPSVFAMQGEVTPTNPLFIGKFAGQAHSAKIKSISVEVTPKIPPFNLSPLPAGPSKDQLGAGLHALEFLLAEGARTRALSGYLGNPGSGSQTTTYTWNLFPPTGQGSGKTSHANAFGIGLSLVALAFVAAVGAAVYARN